MRARHVRSPVGRFLGVLVRAAVAAASAALASAALAACASWFPPDLDLGPRPSAPARAVHPLPADVRLEPVVQAGHAGRVTATAFSPDGEHLLSGGDDGTLKIWRIATGELVRTIQAHPGSVSSVTWSPDGSVVVSRCPELAAVSTWRVVDGAPLGTTSGGVEVSFAPDGVLLVGDSWGSARMGPPADLAYWNLELEAGAAEARFVPDGQLVACRSESAVWFARRDGEVLGCFGGGIDAFDISADGRYLATRGEGGIHIFEVEGWVPVRSVEGSFPGSDDLRFIGWLGSTLLALPSSYGETALVDVVTGVERLRIDAGLETLSASWDGRWLAYPDGNRIVLRGESGPLRRLGGWPGPAPVALAPTGDGLVAQRGVDVVAWDFDGGAPAKIGSAAFPELHFAPDGRHLVVCNEANGLLTVKVGPRTGPLRELAAIAEDQSRDDLALGPWVACIRRAAAGGQESVDVHGLDGSLAWRLESPGTEVVDPATGERRRFRLGAIALPADGRWLVGVEALEGYVDRVLFWDLARGGKPVGVLGTEVTQDGDQRSIEVRRLAAGGRVPYVAAAGSTRGGYDSRLVVWDPTRDAVRVLVDRTASWRSPFGLSSDGSRLFVLGTTEPTALELYAVPSAGDAKPLRTVAAPAVARVDWLGDRFLALTHRDHTLTVVDLDGDRRLRLCWLDDGEWVATTDQGHVDGSTGAAARVRFALGSSLEPAERGIPAGLATPGLVAAFLRGEPLPDGVADAAAKLARESAEARQAPAELALGAPRLVDAEGHDRLHVEGLDRVELVIPLRNDGKGPAYGATLRIEPDAATQALALRLQAPRDLGDLAPGAARELRVGVEAPRELADGGAAFTVRVDERRGFHARPLVVRLATRRLRPPAFAISDRVVIRDGTAGHADGDGDGVLESGERAEALVEVENRGEGAAVCRLAAALAGAEGIAFGGAPGAPGATGATGASGTTGEIGASSSGAIEPGQRATIAVPLTARRTAVGAPRLRLAVADPRGLGRAEAEVALRFAARASALRLAGAPSGAVRVERGQPLAFEVWVEAAGALAAEGVELGVTSDRADVQIDRPRAAALLGRVPAGQRSAPVPVAVQVRRDAALGAGTVRITASQADFPPAELVLAFDVCEPAAVVADLGGGPRASPGPSPGARVAPLVSIDALPARTSEETVAVRVRARDDGEVRGIRVLVNGAEVEVARERGVAGVTRAPEPGAARDRTVVVTVALAAGANRIEAVAQDEHGLEGRDEARIERVVAAGRTLAVVVGVASYRSERIPPLRFAERDAQALARYLVAAGAAEADVTVLVDAAATRAAVLRALSALRSRATAADRVVVFFAGHGLAGEVLAGGGAERYLAPHDAEPEPEALLASAIPMDELTRVLGGVAAREVVVFLDACYAGAVGLRSAGEPGEAVLSRALVTGRGRAVFASSRAGQPSREDEGRGHGLFTATLLESLRGAADRNGDGWVDTDELAGHLAREVEARSGGAQRPVYRAEVEAPIRLRVVP